MKNRIILLLLFFLLFSSIASAQSNINRSRPQTEEADGSPSGYFWKWIFPNSSLTDSGDGIVTVDFISPLSAYYLKLDASNDPLSGHLQSGTDGTGYGLTWYSNAVGTYWDIDNDGTWNLYGQGDVIYDGYSSIVLSGATISTNSTIALTPITSGSILFAGSGGVISEDTALFWEDTLNYLRTPTILSDGGTLKLGGVGGTNNENITLDFESGGANIGVIGTSSGLTTLKFDININKFEDSKAITFGTGSDATIRWETTGNDNLQLGLVCGSANSSGYFNIMENADRANANRSPLSVSANPVLRVYSSDASTESVAGGDYIEFYHNQTDGVIDVGNGNLAISADTTINGIDIIQWAFFAN